MAKKTIQSDNTSSPAAAAPERRRTARAATRTKSPEAATGEPGNIPTPMLAQETANERPRSGEGDGPTPTPEQIAEAAYLRYLERGGQHGFDFDDWVEAERTLRGRR